MTVQLMIKGDKFSPASLTIPTSALVTLVYNDQDLDPHNFALYPSQSASTAIFRSRPPAEMIQIISVSTA